MDVPSLFGAAIEDILFSGPKGKEKSNACVLPRHASKNFPVTSVHKWDQSHLCSYNERSGPPPHEENFSCCSTVQQYERGKREGKKILRESHFHFEAATQIAEKESKKD